MKGSEVFQETIKQYLDQHAVENPLFAPKYSNPEKNIEGCINYILATVQKSNLNGFADQEIYSMAIHYYVEDNLEANSVPENIHVVVNHHVELTDEEKKEIEEKAREEAFKEELKKRTTKHQAKSSTPQQPSLFE